MAMPILMPKQGQSVESCTIVEWLKKKGDQVKQGEVLFTYETDKASFEFESPGSGVLLETFFAASQDVPVLTNVAVLGNPGEDVAQFRPGAVPGAAAPEPSAPTAAPAEAPKPAAPAGAPTTQQATDAAPISPRARNLAERLGVDAAQAAPTGPKGRVIERDIKALAEKGPVMTKAAQEKARQEGLIAPAVGSGIGGRVRAEDLLAATAAAPAAPGASAAAGEVTEIKLSGIRAIIGQRMMQSLQGSAQLTMNASANASAMLAFRAEVKKHGETLGLANITITDLVAFAVSRTLPKFPDVNALFIDGKVLQHRHVHLALAVDTPRGLMVPVVRYADRLSLNDLALTMKTLTQQCIAGSINPDLLAGGTLTLSNLGTFGIESFTPVLNPPQVALLGVNTISPRPVMREGGYDMAPHIGLSLTIDHRAVDGAPGARFLKAVVDAIENIPLVLSL